MKNMKSKHILAIVPMVALGILTPGCDLQINPVSNPSELTIATTDTAGSQIKYKDRAAIQAVYLKLYELQ